MRSKRARVYARIRAFIKPRLLTAAFLHKFMQRNIVARAKGICSFLYFELIVTLLDDSPSALAARLIFPCLRVDWTNTRLFP